MPHNNWIEIITAFAQIGIAVSVACIAFQSYKVNRAGFYVNKDQLRLNLFDRRYKVFEDTRNFLRDFTILTTEIDSKKFPEFILNTIETEFLFGNEVKDYRQEIINKYVRLKTINSRFERNMPDHKERERLAQEASDLESWLASQDEQLKKIFRKYLHFSIDADPV